MEAERAASWVGGHTPISFASPFDAFRTPGTSRRRAKRAERTLDTFEAMEARRAGRVIVDDVDGFSDEDEAECSDY